MAGASTAAVHGAAARLVAQRPVPMAFVWAAEDRVFPLAHAERYAAAVGGGRVVRIDDAYSFMAEDQPQRLAAALAALAEA